MGDISVEGCAALEPGLTPTMRKWLRDPEKAKWRTWEVTVGFCKTFNLHPGMAGRLLGMYAIECWRGM